MTGPRQAALFDLDGVLLDSAAAVRSTLAAVATCALGRRVMPDDLPPAALRRPRCEVLALLDVADPDDACDRWWDGAASTLPVEPFPGILAGLLALRAQGTAVGVVTVQDPDRLRWLLPPALTKLLEVVVTRQDAPPKPAPDGLHLALSRLDIPPERAVFVGDSPTDMTAARAAGVVALGAVWGWHPPAALHAAGADHLLPEPASIGPSLLNHLPPTDSA
ncbi:HAD family hydrolase (plasmid) [Streptomyces sp. NBC_01591]|uniref:HAD family hydrolase n=1 Tax=Streptomyces sp. NBC_01591 TaxID=2975888 RepID=UPI002DDA5A5F|nr:HAD family hydrolase [Streptomyces sp. NBC_01591]WSD66114.1 HAD family hydrolase [Streptomyces sp. NBC_01591]WSD73003.1 HAD family hydrolase [Streptomyces sp. NBC_01591]WSD73720.1 HAD family hydrolase [Streptomyces sp. NBC_01591]WSD74492.1 HAD family hydrolase [Streptomyces sp. NBC_01591]